MRSPWRPGHLTPTEVVDALDGRLARDRRPHLDTCPRCQEEVDGLADVWRVVAEDEVPEPSPLYWDHLAERVHEAALAASPSTASSERWRVRGLVGVGAGAALALLLVAGRVWWTSGVEPTPEVSASRDLEAAVDARPYLDAPAPLDPGDPVDGWAVVLSAVDETGWEADAAEALVDRTILDAVLLSLDEDERQALAQVLRDELEAAGS